MHTNLNQQCASSAADRTPRRGKVPMILMWALGVPIPILLIIFLFRGCAG